MQMNVRRFVFEARDGFVEPELYIGHCCVGDADMQIADQATAHRADLGTKGVEGLKQIE